MLYDRALKLDPGYAIAWVGLGWHHQLKSDVAAGVLDAERRETGRAAMLSCGRKALELDPFCADAYCLIVYYHLDVNEFDDVIEMSEKALAMAPNGAEILLTEISRRPRPKPKSMLNVRKH